MLSPPKENLVEKYFRPDNMLSSEKMKIEPKKVRDEFKMSESDCGSARVQVAQLTTKIKHLSTALHKKPVPEFDSFTVDERPGEQWIRLSKKYGENEEIKVEVTTFDGFLPVHKTGGVAADDNVELHITMIVDIFKRNGNSVLVFVCSAWPNSIEIQKVFVREHDRMGCQPYTGPEFKDLDDELQDSLGKGGYKNDDELAVFLHGYTKNKDKSEFIRWMGSVKSFIDMKQKIFTI